MWKKKQIVRKEERKEELDICCRHRRRILPALRHRPLTDPSFPVDATNVMQVYELQEYTILTFEPLYDPLMTFYYITHRLSCLECHTHTFSQVSGQLKHFEKFDFRTPL